MSIAITYPLTAIFYKPRIITPHRLLSLDSRVVQRHVVRVRKEFLLLRRRYRLVRAERCSLEGCEKARAVHEGRWTLNAIRTSEVARIRRRMVGRGRMLLHRWLQWFPVFRHYYSRRLCILFCFLLCCRPAWGKDIRWNPGDPVLTCGHRLGFGQWSAQLGR